MKFLVTLILILPWCTSVAQVDSVDVWISRIHNGQLHGTCHYFWTIEVDKNADDVFHLIKKGKPLSGKLLEKLTDRNTGVIAHFILSTIWDELKIETLEMDDINVKYRVNGLEFIEKNGTTSATRADLERIRSFWEKRNR